MDIASVHFWLRRLKEPSTYASIAALLGILGVNMDSDIWQSAVYLMMAVAGFVGIILPDPDKKN